MHYPARSSHQLVADHVPVCRRSIVEEVLATDDINRADGFSAWAILWSEHPDRQRARICFRNVRYAYTSERILRINTLTTSRKVDVHRDIHNSSNGRHRMELPIVRTEYALTSPPICLTCVNSPAI